MDFRDVWNKIAGKPPVEQPEAKRKQPAKPVRPSPAEQQKQAAKDRVQRPGPAERYLVKNPDVLQKAVDAKADREKPKPTSHDHVPPTIPRPGPTIQTPMGPMRMTPQASPSKPPPAATPRKPTSADRMLERAKQTLPSPSKPPPQTFRERHPDAGRNRGR